MGQATHMAVVYIHVFTAGAHKYIGTSFEHSLLSEPWTAILKQSPPTWAVIALAFTQGAATPAVKKPIAAAQKDVFIVAEVVVSRL